MENVKVIPQVRRHILTPVRQNAADTHMLGLIATYAVTVILVRTYLQLSGYPQVGDSTFHIAHLLWGGLFMFVALVLLLVWANSWVYGVGAVLGGIGAGLFIDEVGKFITQNNDYFYPLAFPIIYSVALAGTWLYFRFRRSERRDTRTLLYHSFRYLEKVLDNNLDPVEYRELIDTLQQANARAEDPSQRELAKALYSFVQSQQIEVEPLDWNERLVAHLRAWLSTYPPRRVLKTLLLAGLAFVAFLAAFKLVGLMSVAAAADFDIRSAFSSYVIVNGKSSYVVNHVALLLAEALSIFAAGALALLAGLAMVAGRDKMGLRLAVLGLVVSLTVVNLITFYFNQLYTLFDTVVQLSVLGTAQLYRWRFLLAPGVRPPAAGGAAKDSED